MTVQSRDKGIVLLIVLAFIVLLTGVVIAYFSRTTAARPLAKANVSATAADILARSGVDIVVADVQQEIANGATITNSNVVPQRSPTPVPGTTPAIPNLIRRSVRADGIPAPAVASRASAVNSTTDLSLNGRSISLARWNSHYLVPKATTTNDSSDPITTGYTGPEFWAPDWVLVTRAGPTAVAGWNSNLSDAAATNSSFVVGRYAYAMYDEGGLLDFNVAGYPYPSPSPAITPPALVANIGRKGTAAFADLTGMRLTSGNGTANPATITNMVAWRNYATINSAGTFPNLTSSDPAAATFVKYALNAAADFLTVPTTTYKNRTDQAVMNRKELIELFSSVGASFNMLKYLGTFSRETNHPTWGTFLTGRFPLSRFDLFATTPPSDAASIQKFFGIKYVAASTSGTTTTAEHWSYVGTSGSTQQSAIPKITASTPDADLPRLLQYALPSASTGEVLSIEASLIDQRDGGSDDTTWIEYGNPSPAPQLAWGADKNPPPTPAPYPSSAPVVIDRAFRNVGEIGYAYRNASTKLDFHSTGSSDAPLLDLFTYNTAAQRAGIVSLNTQNAGVLAALLQSAIKDENSSDFVGRTDAASNHAKTAYASVVPMIKAAAVKPLLGRHETTRLVAAAGAALGTTDEAQETAARALAEVGQTRTWGLLIDVIAQSGRYPPNATSLSQFVVEGEQRYWLHIAIDRLTNKIIDQQIEAVYE